MVKATSTCGEDHALVRLVVSGPGLRHGDRQPLLLRDSADKMPLSEEELERMHKRNAEQDAKARQDDGEDE